MDFSPFEIFPVSNSVEEFKLAERVKESYLKHRGRILEILKDVNFPPDKEHIEYLQRLIEKFQGKNTKDPNVFIARRLVGFMMLGHDSRVHHLMLMLDELDGRTQVTLSVCCEAPIRRVRVVPGISGYSGGSGYSGSPESNAIEVTQCLSCHLNCETELVEEEGIIRLKNEIIEQLREEDKLLMEFADKMGYTTRVEPESPIIIQNKQNILVLGNDRDRALAKDYKNLPSIQKEQLVEKLRKEIASIDEEIAKEQDGPKGRAEG